MNLKLCILVIFCIVVTLITKSRAECYIDTNPNAWIKPKFLRSFKTATTLVYNQTQRIHMADGEEIIGYCKTGFTNSQYGDFKIEISCRDNEIYFTDSYGETQVTEDHDLYNPPNYLFECTASEKLAKPCLIIPAPENAGRPKFFKQIGTRSIRISEKVQNIHLHHDQKITIQCDNKFLSPNHQSSVLTSICLDGQLVSLGHPFHKSYDAIICQSLHWNLYESTTQFPWCPTHMASYILARPTENTYFEYLAGICYDLEQMSLKTLYYAEKAQFVRHLSPKVLESYKPLMEIPDVNDSFISKKTFIYDNKQIENWIKFANFKSSSIVQNSRLYRENFKEFDNLLSVDWWSSLHLGNWQNFEEALEKHIQLEYSEYDILTGTSGIVAAPIHKENCHQNLTMMALVDTDNNKYPLYVWKYLKSSQNVSQDVVIIGVNSPFYDFYAEKHLVFCHDICHKFKWLESVRSTFRYKSMGIVFCCSVDEVIASQQLDGFAIPKEAPPPTPVLELEKYKVWKATTAANLDWKNYDQATEADRDSEEYDNSY